MLSSVELYDPATDSWSSASSLATARDFHTATILLSGKVLVAGGLGSDGGAELYDPDNNRWNPAGRLARARLFHTATLLKSGQVLVAGGADLGALASAELYTPNPVVADVGVPVTALSQGKWLALLAGLLILGAMRAGTRGYASLENGPLQCSALDARIASRATGRSSGQVSDRTQGRF